MSSFTIDKPGVTRGIVPTRCASNAMPQKFGKATAIGPIKSVTLDATGVDHDYEDDLTASVTAPLFSWILENATAPIAIELVTSTVYSPSMIQTGNGLVLMAAFSSRADERAYRLVEKAIRQKSDSAEDAS